MILHVHMCDFSFVWCFPFQGRVGGISTLFKRAALPTLLSLRSPTHAEGGISTGVPESCNRKAWPFADSIICHLPVTKTWFVRYRLKLQPFLSLPRLCIRSESATKREAAFHRHVFMSVMSIVCLFRFAFVIYPHVLVQFDDHDLETHFRWRAYPRDIWLNNILLYIILLDVLLLV